MVGSEGFLSNIDKDVEQIFNDHDFVLGLHVPTLVVSDVTTGFHLNRTEFVVVFVRDENVHVRGSIRGQGSDPTTPQQLAENVVLACSSDNC